MPVTNALLISNVLAYLLLTGSGLPIVEWFALWPPTGFTSLFEPWQLVTYSFLHGSIAHIVFNMFALYTFGAGIERLFGSRFYLLYYFACVVGAALAQLTVVTLQGGLPYPTVGASGGVFGLLLAFGMMFPRRMILLIFPPIPMPAWLFVTLYGVIELVLGVTGSQAGVAHFAHLGGMVAGFALIQYWRHSRRQRW